MISLRIIRNSVVYVGVLREYTYTLYYYLMWIYDTPHIKVVQGKVPIMPCMYVHPRLLTKMCEYVRGINIRICNSVYVGITIRTTYLSVELMYAIVTTSNTMFNSKLSQYTLRIVCSRTDLLPYVC